MAVDTRRIQVRHMRNVRLKAHSTRRRSLRRQTGAVAVEAGVIFAVLLGPLCMGVMKWGAYFHDVQRVEMTEIPQMDSTGAKFWKQGQSCASLADRIRDSFAASLMRTNADLFGSKST